LIACGSYTAAASLDALLMRTVLDDTLGVSELAIVLKVLGSFPTWARSDV